MFGTENQGAEIHSVKRRLDVMEERGSASSVDKLVMEFSKKQSVSAVEVERRRRQFTVDEKRKTFNRL